MVNWSDFECDCLGRALYKLQKYDHGEGKHLLEQKKHL